MWLLTVSYFEPKLIEEAWGLDDKDRIQSDTEQTHRVAGKVSHKIYNTTPAVSIYPLVNSHAYSQMVFFVCVAQLK